MTWSTVEAEYGPTIKANPNFDTAKEDGANRYDDLRRCVVEHDVRVMSNYYSCVTVQRLCPSSWA